MPRLVSALVACAVAALASGCMAKYRNTRTWARDTFSDTFNCEPGRVMPRELEVGYAVDGCGISATCDVVRGDWRCSRMDPPHVRAWKVLLTQTTCPKERVVATRQTHTTAAQTVVQLDACGTPFTCTAQALGDVHCQAMNVAVDDGAPVPVDFPSTPPPLSRTPPGSGQQAPPPPPPPPPPPAASEECLPKCRSGYVCIKGGCVSACNPPCAKGERCTDSGECVGAK